MKTKTSCLGCRLKSKSVKYFILRVYDFGWPSVFQSIKLIMSSPPDTSKEAEANRQRQSNLQRIQQRKQAVRCWPLDKKLEKLAIYSSCKASEDCKCNGMSNLGPQFKSRTQKHILSLLIADH